MELYSRRRVRATGWTAPLPGAKGGAAPGAADVPYRRVFPGGPVVRRTTLPASHSERPDALCAAGRGRLLRPSVAPARAHRVSAETLVRTSSLADCGRRISRE